MLPSADAITRSRWAVDEGNPLIYTDEYDVAALA